ncbi:MAG: type III-A CRISPR-associated protein Cas10/Csm1, partial [Epsilonproteobacteria bacterium]|nr:type III-A CRISPR-associated protein Cas10/Csm1 [Campylobacterota bacterium]
MIKEGDKIALMALLHDIGKFRERARIELGEKFDSKKYRFPHAHHTAEFLKEYFPILSSYHRYAYSHHNPQDKNSWIIAIANRMAHSVSKEQYEKYNQEGSKEDENVRLINLFNSKKEYPLTSLEVENIIKEFSSEEGYETLWKRFKEDLKKIDTNNLSGVDLLSIDYLLKKYTTFIPAITNWEKLKGKTSLYDHLHLSAVFAQAIFKLPKEHQDNLIESYKTGDEKSQREFLLINGDFFGIQDFIFNEVETRFAAKILRGKSAFVQFLTKVIAFYIIEKLELSTLSIVSEGAGKFEILAPNTSAIVEKLPKLQEELNTYFVSSFFGETGVGVSYIECSIFDFLDEKRYKELRQRLFNVVIRTKLKKFNLSHQSYNLKWEDGLTDKNK